MKNKKELKKIEQVAITAIKKSAKKLTTIYYNFKKSNIKLKSKHEIVSYADLLSEKIIIKEIKNNLPDHHILSEEKGDNFKKSDYLWIIDPIDGTTNFTIKNPLWAISIGIAYKNEVVLGFIYAPVLDELYIAKKDKGAYLNNKRIKISKTENKKIIHTFCHGSDLNSIKRAINYYKYQKLNSLDCRQLGSASIELAYVAAGRIESIAIPGAHSWDVSAGTLLVKEAGGRVSDFNNKNWTLDSKDMLASNKFIHTKLVKILKNI